MTRSRSALVRLPLIKKSWVIVFVTLSAQGLWAQKGKSFEGTNAVGPDFIADATSGPPLQVNSTTLVPNLNVDFLNGLHSSAFARLSTSNTFTGNQTINGSVIATSFVGNGASLTGIPPAENPVAWWPGDGVTTDIVAGNNGTLQNGAGYASAVVSQGFNVSNGSYVDVPDNASLNPTAAITVSAWVNATSFGQLSAVVKKSDLSQTGGYTIEMCDPPASHICFAVSLAALNGGFSTVTSSTSLQPNTWYHVAGTYDGSAIRLYIDGILEASTPATGALATSSNHLNIGHDPSSPVDSRRFWNGIIDEVKIYNRALSAAEVRTFGFMPGAYLPH
jgi:hypothetical protein